MGASNFTIRKVSHRGDALRVKESAAGAGSVNNKRGGSMRTRCAGILLASWACVALFSVAVACAQTPSASGEGEFGCKGKKFEKHLKELNLTPEQKTQLDTQRAAQREAMETIRQSIETKHQELRAEIDKETTEKAKIDSIAVELKNLEAQRIDQEIKGNLRMKEVLTPDQFKKLNAIREKRKEGKHGMWKKQCSPPAQPASGSSSASPESGGPAPNN
jgi:Spy/CpxP family protein refolding chaperone